MDVGLASAPASDTFTMAPFVLLKGGLAVPLEALQLAWALENRGATFVVDGADLVVDGPRGLLTEADRIGEVVWNRTRKCDTWGQKRQSARPEKEWIHAPMPALRIVSNETVGWCPWTAQWHSDAVDPRQWRTTRRSTP
jgi:hypothetical protein